MTTLTTEPLGADVGAEIVGADRDRLLTDEAFPTFCLEALEAPSILSLKGCRVHVTAGAFTEGYLASRALVKTP